MSARRDESLDAQGIPEVEEHPPGIDIETAQEGLIPPGDRPLAAGGGPGYPVTAEEGRIPEGVAERAEREEPDVGARELGVGGGVQGADELRAAQRRAPLREPDDETTPDGVRVLDPLVASEDDEVERGLGRQLVGAGDAGEMGTGEVGEAIALDLDEDDETAESPEESAMHIEEGA